MNLWLTLAAAEIGLVVFGLLLSVWVGQLLARRRDRRAVRTLVDRVTAQKAQRTEAIHAFLKKNFELSDDELQAHAASILREELRLYQRFANLYLRRDAGSVANFQLSIEAGVEPYWQLEGRRAASASPAEVELVAAADEAELGRLRADVERLQRRSSQLGEHLALAVENLARMLDEYSALFDDATLDELSGAPLIAEAREVIAETGLGGGPNAPAPTPSGLEEDGPGSVEPAPASEFPLDSEAVAEDEQMPESGRVETEPEQEPAGGESQPLAAADPRSEPVGSRVDRVVDSIPTAGRAPGEARSDAVEPDDDVVTVESPAAKSAHGATAKASPAADELLASLDANLPAPPEDDRPPSPVLADGADLDDLFDAEPGFDAVAAPGDAGTAGDTGRFDPDERDDESVAIVHKDKTDNVLI